MRNLLLTLALMSFSFSATAQTVYYKNCAAVWAAGKAPLLKGQPGYRPGLDRDRDGIACEKRPRR